MTVLDDAVPDDAARAAELPGRLAALRERVETAARDAGRDPSDVAVLLATKTMSLPVVRAAVRAGATLLGENRVQELVAKAPGLVDLAPTMHVIGPLQANKVNAAVRWASCVESVDDLAIAERLSRRCTLTDRDLEVMVQVNVSGEATKSGVAPAAAVALACEVAALPRLTLVGLMTVGAHSDDDAVVRSGYGLLHELRTAVVESGAPGTASCRDLSMGMSGDLEAAIAEGATIVRVGTAAFGQRAPLAGTRAVAG